ncbi:MAG TPA: aminotransferase class V-fold PLP-dependent enzyme, partial [Longimicrobiales bacterium]|nr:aminotransferase class V-fold PLP-dependent enzyme [Longimicrobiales bacterium]
DGAPERMEIGTQNHEGIAGAAAAVEFLASLAEGGSRRERLATGFEMLHERGAVLLRRMWEGLADIPGVRLYGPPPGTPRTPTLAFTVDGRRPEEVMAALDRAAVFVSHGEFYALTVIRRLGREPEGVVRAGCACYTTEAEVDRLVAGVAAVARGP